MIASQRYLPPALALLSGTLLGLAFPNHDQPHLIWFGLIPLVAALWSLRETGKHLRRRAFRLGWLTGFAYFAISVGWVSSVSIFAPEGIARAGLWCATMLLPAYLGLYVALWAVFVATLGKPRFEFDSPGLFTNSLRNLAAALLSAAAWTGLEWLRSIVFTGFGWNGLGAAHWSDPTLSQAADLIGVTGLSFTVALVACTGTGLVWRMVREFRSRKLRPHADFALVATLVIGQVLYGVTKLQTDFGTTRDLRTLIVQPDIPQDEKWDGNQAERIFGILDSLTAPYVTTMDDLDLVVWPESVLPMPLDVHFNLRYLSQNLSAGDHHLLLGTNIAVGETAFYNGVALLQHDPVHQRQLYYKVHRVPFGEYVPLRDIFPPFRWIAGAFIPWDFHAGQDHRPLRLGDTRIEIAPSICFEDTLGRHARKFVQQGGGHLLVNVTNDGWFGESSESRQHLANSIFRTIELRRPMIRCANSGISAVIDPLGRVTGIVADPDTGSTFVRQARTFTIPIPEKPPTTLYAIYGDAFSICCGLIALIFVSLRVLDPRRRNRQDQQLEE